MEEINSIWPIPEVVLSAPDQLPAFRDGLTALATGAASSTYSGGGLETFVPSMNAFASIVMPADDQVPYDQPAGKLVLRVKGKKPVTFGDQMILLIRKASPLDLWAGLPPSQLPILEAEKPPSAFFSPEETEEHAGYFFAELDAQAQTPKYGGKPTFAELTGPEQQRLVDDALDSTSDLVPITIYGSQAKLALQTLGRQMVVVVRTTYWLNFPEHRVRDGELGFGEGELIFSDKENLITNPNFLPEDDSNSTVGDNTVGDGTVGDHTVGDGHGRPLTAFDYLGWQYPLRIGVERRYELAFVEAQAKPQASVDALHDLVADDLADTLFKDP